jgi:hypothetical protein
MREKQHEPSSRPVMADAMVGNALQAFPDTA